MVILVLFVIARFLTFVSVAVGSGSGRVGRAALKRRAGCVPL